MDMRAWLSGSNYSATFPDYWKNNFDELRCIYLGPETDEQKLANTNQTYGYEVKLLSHVCLNGSFSNLSYEQWNDRCFPSHAEGAVGWRRAAGAWSAFNFIVGLLGNLLTIAAVLHAKAKQR